MLLVCLSTLKLKVLKKGYDQVSTPILRVGFGIGILNFGLNRKIPKIPKFRGSGSVFENPEKIRTEKSRNPRDRVWI